MSPRGSFRLRIFIALVAIAVVPVAVALAGGTLALREIVSGSGTAGPWESVAESGRTLLDEVERSGLDGAELRSAAEGHRVALSESVRLSRLYATLADRFLELLPVLALAMLALVTGLALFTAGWVSRSLSRPIRELVGWTERIARTEPLPSADEAVAGGPREFDALRGALRSMDDQLRRARDRELESARLRTWTEMARRVAHELKNPLTPMRMAARTVAGSSDPSLADASRVLLEETARLDELARSFAQFGRMPEGPTSEIDLAELLTGLSAQHGTPEIPLDVEVRVEDTFARGYYEPMVRVFRNLVVNAIEATTAARASGSDAGGVRLVLEGDVEGLRVSILDEGPGIDPAYLERIWSPDFTTRTKGTGLGLALVRKTVEAHGGTATAANRRDGGAEFVVTLPRAGASAVTDGGGEDGADPASPASTRAKGRTG